MEVVQKTVMVFGTFDILHLGHIAFFKEAKKYGDRLIVVVARDRRAQGIKGDAPVFSERDRASLLHELSIIDKVLIGDKVDVYKVIKNVKPEVIVLGYDQHVFTEKLEEKIKEFELPTEIVRIKAYKPQTYKSTIAKSKIADKKNDRHLVVPLGILVRDGKILLNKRNDKEKPFLHGLWEFPGGGMEIGETIEENLVREVREECGYEIEIVSMLKKIWTINDRNSSMVSNQNLNIYLVPFVCTIQGGTGQVNDDEVLETVWLSPDKVTEYNLIGENKKMYEQIYKELIHIINTKHL